jgi:hypothetical protein
MKLSLNIKLAIVAGILNCILWYAVAVNLGFYEIKVYVIRNFSTLGFLLVGIFISIFFLKKNNNGFLEFKNALKTGMLYSLVLAVILAAFNYIYYTFITPDTIDYFLSEAKKAAIAHNIKPEEMKKFLEGEKLNFGSFKLIPPVLFFGLIISLLAGALFQKKDPNAINAE